MPRKDTNIYYYFWQRSSDLCIFLELKQIPVSNLRYANSYNLSLRVGLSLAWSLPLQAPLTLFMLNPFVHANLLSSSLILL